MSKQYQLVVFDWEGTLAEDTLGRVLNVLEKEANRLHFGSFDVVAARRYVTLGLSGAIKKLFPDLSLYQQEQLFETVQAVLVTSSSDIYLVDGASAVVRRLYEQGISLAIATNKGHPALVRAMQVTGLDAYFKITRCAGQVPAKPCPQMLDEILIESGHRPDEAVMIGDSVADIEMAVSLGVDAIGLDFFHLQEAPLLAAGAIHVFDRYPQLNDYLQSGGATR